MRRSFILKLLFLAVLSFSSMVSAQISSTNQNYLLGPGDKISILVFNQAELSGEYSINGSGIFFMPFIDKIQAGGLTIAALSDVIVNKLKPDFLIDPRVNIEVLNFRPYYIIGEINSSGSFPYVEGMTYLNAVAIAGGFTYRAREKYVMIKREDDVEGKEVKLKLDQLVMPGDIIRVTERLF